MTYEGNQRLGDLFSSRREKGRVGLPTLSVTQNNGLVNREDLDRKQDTTLTANEHLLVKPGDIAYNMMRMWQGAFGLAEQEGMVSPAYVVLRPKPTIDSKFAAHMLRAPRIRYLLWAFSHGITDDRLRLYYADFAKIPVSTPTIDRQRRIANLLDTVAASAKRAEDDLLALRKQKAAYVQHLIDRRGAIDKAADRQKIRLGALGIFIRGVAYKPSDTTAAKELGSIPLLRAHNIRDSTTNTEDLVYVRSSVVSASQFIKPQDIVICMSNGSKGLVGKSSVALLPDGQYTFGAFCAVFRPNNKCHSNLVPYLFQSREYKKCVATQLAGSSINNLRTSDLREVEVEIPTDQNSQRAIALALDTVNAAISKREQAIVAMRKTERALLARLFHR